VYPCEIKGGGGGIIRGKGRKWHHRRKAGRVYGSWEGESKKMKRISPRWQEGPSDYSSWGGRRRGFNTNGEGGGGKRHTGESCKREGAKVRTQKAGR